jgi:hydrogenase-1 operon protein HyaF
MAIEDIPVAVATPSDGVTGQAEALLREIAALLERLASDGVGGVIDLRSLPLSPADLHWLQDRLGKGEVSISLDAGGASCILETGIAGVWWVEHRDEQDEMRSEFIEVTYAPALVAAHPDDVAAALEELRKSLRHDLG